MILKRIAFAALAAFALWPACAVAAQSVVHLEDEAHRTALSGMGGDRMDVITDPGRYGDWDELGVRRISWKERSDQPCHWAIRVVNLNDEGRDLYPSEGCSGAQSEKEVGFGADTYVSGLRVCLNRDHDRVKGLHLRGRKVNADGTIQNVSSDPHVERTNCRDWMDWVECPNGQIATGLIVARESGAEPRSARGIGLICRRVSTRAAEASHRFIGETSVTDLAGIGTGKTMDMLPGGDRNHAMDTIEWSEKGDEPCRVVVKGATLGPVVDRGSDTYDLCGGKTRDGSRRQAGPSDPNKYPITGLKVCLHNGRLKGVAIEVSAPFAQGGPQRMRSEGNLTATQPNCREGDFGWSEVVRCPADQLAVGLRVAVREDMGGFDISGMRLLCRRFE
mgnify:CR=1 FL=1